MGSHSCPVCGNIQITDHEHCFECGYDFLQEYYDNERKRFSEYLKGRLSENEINDLIREFELFAR